MEFTALPNLGDKVGVVITFFPDELYGDDFAGKLVRGVRGVISIDPAMTAPAPPSPSCIAPEEESTPCAEEVPEESPLGFGTLDEYDILVDAARAAGFTVNEDELDAESRINFNAWKSQMRYRSMAGDGDPYGGVDPDVALELVRDQTERELLADRYLRQVVREEGIAVTREELEEEAAAIAERQGTTLDMIRGFMGEEFGLLEGDLKRKKALALIVGRSRRQ